MTTGCPVPRHVAFGVSPGKLNAAKWVHYGGTLGIKRRRRQGGRSRYAGCHLHAAVHAGAYSHGKSRGVPLVVT